MWVSPLQIQQPSSPEAATTPSTAYAFHTTRSKSRNVITAMTPLNHNQQQQPETVDDSVQTAEKPKMAHKKVQPQQVTPLDQFPLELIATKADSLISISSTSAMAGKQVRFTAADTEGELLTKVQPNVASKGCVSKRGRYVSPGRRSCNKEVKGSSESSSLPMSPQSLLVGDGSGPSMTQVPSLCSAPSHDEATKLPPHATSTTAKENDFMVCRIALSLTKMKHCDQRADLCRMLIFFLLLLFLFHRHRHRHTSNKISYPTMTRLGKAPQGSSSCLYLAQQPEIEIDMARVLRPTLRLTLNTYHLHSLTPPTFSRGYSHQLTTAYFLQALDQC